MAQSLRKTLYHYMEFCQIMSTPNSKLTETDVFGFFNEYPEMVRDKWIELYMPIVSNTCKQYLSRNVKWRHLF